MLAVACKSLLWINLSRHGFRYSLTAPSQGFFGECKQAWHHHPSHQLHEVIAQLYTAFNNVMSFLQTSKLYTVPVCKMTDILNNAGLCCKLKIELAITVDAMDAFIRATYDLEGDGPLSQLHMSVSALCRHIHV